MLYDTVRESDGFYNSPVDEAVRSCMNVPFTIPSSSDLEKTFLSESTDAGLVRPTCQLRIRGTMRAVSQWCCDARSRVPTRSQSARKLHAYMSAQLLPDKLKWCRRL